MVGFSLTPTVAGPSDNTRDRVPAPPLRVEVTPPLPPML